jgi:riboflavin kinase/FMN adenylyltransferase
MITRLPDVRRRPRRVAVGTFDGVHLGHREVIQGSDTVVTFDPHPSTVVHPGNEPRLLTDLERKADLVAALGVQELVVIDFDEPFAARSAQEFLDEILAGPLQATHVSVGENFRFGRHAEGDAALLAADERFDTRVVRLLEEDGEIVSSSHIRGLLLGGAVEYAARLLGEPFALCGTVVAGDRVGRTLGFPTANIVPDPRFVTPAHGIYACWARVRGDAEADSVAAAVNIGVRPTFETGRGELVEAYLLDYDGDLYGQTLQLKFLKRLRGEKRFESVDDLVAQMTADVEATRELCA